MICTCMNGWVNNRETGYLRRHRSHYAAKVMTSAICDYLQLPGFDFRHNDIICRVVNRLLPTENVEQNEEFSFNPRK